MIREGDFGCPSLANVTHRKPQLFGPQETIPEELGKPVSSSGYALGSNSSGPAGALRKKSAEVSYLLKK